MSLSPAKIEYPLRVLQEYIRQVPHRGALVCCHASVSRSAAIVLAYLMGCGIGVHEAYCRLEKIHPKLDIHPELMRSPSAYFGTDSSSEKVILGSSGMKRSVVTFDCGSSSKC